MQAPVALSMDVEKSGTDTFRVTGRVTTRLELGCGRCVEPFDIAVDAPSTCATCPQAAEAAGTGREREIDDDDLSDGVLQGRARWTSST